MENQQRQQQQTSPSRHRPPRKPRDNQLRSCFEITHIPADDAYSVICHYCGDYSKIIKRFNPTKARTHLVMHCVGVGDTMRRVLLEGSQEFKRLKRLGEVNKVQATAAVDEDGVDDGEAVNPAAANIDQDADASRPLSLFPQLNNSNSKTKPFHMKHAAQLHLQSEKRTLERHHMDMWKDCSRELTRLRQELNAPNVSLEVKIELEEDIAGLKRKKAEFARLLGMSGGVGAATTDSACV